MAQISYGSITIVDITDVGKLSVFPTSNQPLTVIYNPDNNSYAPNWGTNNLTLEANVYYNNTALTTANATIVWKKKVGIGAEENLGAGEVVQTNGNLVVSQNKFTPATSMITYIVRATYQEPSSGTQLQAEGQITFSMVTLASNAKMCNIIGDTVFKYNTNQELISDTSLVLTGQTSTNLSITGWQYKHKNANDEWVWSTYPNSTVSSTLTVSANDNVFTNDSVTIKFIAHDINNNTFFDLHTIVKLRDGAAGSGAVATLTNDNQMIPFPSQGTPDASVYTQAKSIIVIYDDGEVDTENWTITHVNAVNVTFTSSTTTAQNDTIQITSLTGDVGSVTFHCEKGTEVINKIFSVVKVTQGRDGSSPEIYSIETENGTVAINKTNPPSGTSVVYTPSSLKIYAKKIVGDTKTDYNGRVQIKCGSSSGLTHTFDLPNNSQNYVTITSSYMAEAMGASGYGYIVVNLYKTSSSASADLLDSQTITIVTDGAKGDPGQGGEPGAAAFNVILGNQNDIINCNASNQTLGQTIDIPFAGYQGTTQITCTAAQPANLFGATASVTQGSSSQIGHIIYTIPAGQSVTNSSGTIQLSFTATNSNNESVAIIHNYTWSRNSAPTNGVNAKLFELYAPTGNIFTSRDAQTLDIRGRLMDGSSDVTLSGSNWLWYVYTGASSTPDNDGYVQILSSTEGYSINNSILSVSNSVVNGYASFKCKCTYESSNYVAYYVLYDKLDPITIEIFSSVGDKIVNKQGCGALYVVVTDTGTGNEIDPMPTTTFATTPPSPATLGQWYYHLDNVNRTVTLKRYVQTETSTGWVANADLPSADQYQSSGTYSWTYRNKDGVLTTPVGMATSGKVVYIDGTFIQQKLICNVSATI